MRAHQLDANGVILNTIVVPALDFMSGLVDASIGGQAGDRIANGKVLPAPPSTPTLAEYQALMQHALDTKPKERNYDGILSLCTYATSTNPRFAAEGQAGVAWRDEVWAFGYGLMAKVKAGAAPPPTLDELAAMLPRFTWPDDATP